MPTMETHHAVHTRETSYACKVNGSYILEKHILCIKGNYHLHTRETPYDLHTRYGLYILWKHLMMYIKSK